MLFVDRRVLVGRLLQQLMLVLGAFRISFGQIEQHGARQQTGTQDVGPSDLAGLDLLDVFRVDESRKPLFFGVVLFFRIIEDLVRLRHQLAGFLGQLFLFGSVGRTLGLVEQRSASHDQHVAQSRGRFGRQRMRSVGLDERLEPVVRLVELLELGRRVAFGLGAFHQQMPFRQRQLHPLVVREQRAVFHLVDVIQRDVVQALFFQAFQELCVGFFGACAASTQRYGKRQYAEQSDGSKTAGN